MWRVALVLGLSVLGCAAPPKGPFFGDERYLRFGVDPNQEANAVIEDQKARHYPLSLRVLGQNFTALGFMDPGGRSASVRILTKRGIAVALDPEVPPLRPPLSWALIEGPIADTQDADRDGFEEVFVERRSQEGTCLQIFRVRDVGFVDPVELDTTLFGQTFCASAVLDLDGDGITELMAELELEGFGQPAPQIRVPLFARSHRYAVHGDPNALREFAASERAARVPELSEAQRKRQGDVLLRAAVEQAALANLEGRDAAEQVASFDAAIRGVKLRPTHAAAAVEARARIAGVWNAPQERAASPAAASSPQPATESKKAPATPAKPAQASPPAAPSPGPAGRPAGTRTAPDSTGHAREPNALAPARATPSAADAWWLGNPHVPAPAGRTETRARTVERRAHATDSARERQPASAPTVAASAPDAGVSERAQATSAPSSTSTSTSTSTSMVGELPRAPVGDGEEAAREDPASRTSQGPVAGATGPGPSAPRPAPGSSAARNVAPTREPKGQDDARTSASEPTRAPSHGFKPRLAPRLRAPGGARASQDDEAAGKEAARP